MVVFAVLTKVIISQSDLCIVFMAKLTRWTLVLYVTDPLSGSKGHSSSQHNVQTSRDQFHHSPPDGVTAWSVSVEIFDCIWPRICGKR